MSRARSATRADETHATDADHPILVVQETSRAGHSPLEILQARPDEGGEPRAGALIRAWTCATTSTGWPPTCATVCSPARVSPGEDLTVRIRALVDREAARARRGRARRAGGPDSRAGVRARAAGAAAADPAVEEVMVCGTGRSGSSAAGGSRRRRCAFERERELRDAIERILAPLGRRVDEAEPLVDARLPDGSRVNVVIPPLALDGPVAHDPPLPPARVQRRGAGRQRHAHARRCSTSSRARCARAATLLVCGGTGSGKTTTLNALSSFIDAGERVVTIEDAAELRLQPAARHPARGASAEPRGARRGHDPAARAQRVADAARPDRRRRGPRRRGARHADRAVDGPRRLAVARSTPARRPRRCGGSRRSR